MVDEDKVSDQGSAGGTAESQGKDGGQVGKQPAQGVGESEQGGATKSETVSRAMYEKLQSDLENFKRIEDERKTKEKKRQEELLKEQGKYRELYEGAQREVETMRAQLSKLEEAMAAMVEEEMKDLPTEFDKSLVPNVESYDKITWLRKAKNAFVKKTEPRKGDGTPPAGGEGLAAITSIFTHPSSPRH